MISTPNIKYCPIEKSIKSPVQIPQSNVKPRSEPEISHIKLRKVKSLCEPSENSEITPQRDSYNKE